MRDKMLSDTSQTVCVHFQTINRTLCPVSPLVLSAVYFVLLDDFLC